MAVVIHIRSVLEARCMECGRPVWHPKDECPDREAMAVVFSYPGSVEAYCSQRCAATSVGYEEPVAVVEGNARFRIHEAPDLPENRLVVVSQPRTPILRRERFAVFDFATGPDPEAMHGAADGFGGSDFDEG